MGRYTEAGVDIDAARKAVKLMKPYIHSTHTKHTVTDIGLFGGLTDISFLKEYEHPILVQSIDGVGTKLIVAEMMKKFDTIGQDIVNHCVNDILCQGAFPIITFLDYVASNRLKPEEIEQVVKGMAIVCRKIGLSIVGGETAEMSDVYQKGRHDVVGCVTGVVEKEAIIDGSKIKSGDMLIGLPSDGLHTSGFSLARQAFFKTAGYQVNTYLEGLDCTVGEELLKPHKCYFKAVTSLLQAPDIDVHGIAHITGGGFFDNIGRLLPSGLCAEITYEWEIPAVFQLIQKIESVSVQEMRRVFNLGIGMVLVVPFEQTKMARQILQNVGGERLSIVIGTIEKIQEGTDKVIFTY